MKQTENFVNMLLSSRESQWLAVIGTSLFIVVIALIVIILQRRRFLEKKQETDRVFAIIRGVRTTERLEHNLGIILNVIATMVEAPYYAFYTLDARSNRYLLKVVNHPEGSFGHMGPSYSGLALPKRESYLPPVTVDAPLSQQSVKVITTGEVPMIILQTEEKKALIRIGPVDHVSKTTKRDFSHLLNQIGKLIDDLVSLEMERLKTEVAALGGQAIQRVASIATDVNAAIEIVVHAFSGIAGGIGGILVAEDNAQPAVYGSGQINDFASRLQHDAKARAQLRSFIGNREYHIVTRTDETFYRLPEFMASFDLGAVAFVNIPHHGLLLFFYGSNFSPNHFVDSGASHIRVLAEQLSGIASYHATQSIVTKTYAQMMWRMADMVDNFNPYTVGYAEMMTYYSLVIGKQIGMSDAELKDLALAAHLSNIGVLGVNMELMVKEGKYTEFEYESMKQHAEIGASMIQVATGNQRAAAYVLSHHERMDGLGFPHGLRGQDIPIGSRILHVVQVFLAKINGRSWRSSLSFGQAIHTLLSASGKDLDGTVVEAFILWLEERRSQPEMKDRSLARCYELCRTPKSICESCAVYQRDDVNCWEVGDNRCKSHGRECSTCFVRTEYLHRLDKV